MQEVMQQRLMRKNPKGKQEIKVSLKRGVKEKTRDPHPKADTNQMRRKTALKSLQ